MASMKPIYSASGAAKTFDRFPYLLVTIRDISGTLGTMHPNKIAYYGLVALSHVGLALSRVVGSTNITKETGCQEPLLRREW